MVNLGLWLLPFLLTGCFWSSQNSSSQSVKEKVVILTYSSFASEWGPGLDLKREFEKINPQVVIEYVKAEDANLILKKAIALDRAGHRVVDIILGMDNLTYQGKLSVL